MGRASLIHTSVTRVCSPPPPVPHSRGAPPPGTRLHQAGRRGDTASPRQKGPPDERLASLALGMGDALDQGSADCGRRDDSPSMFVNKALLERGLALLPGSDGSLQQTGVLLTCLGWGSVHHVKQTQLLPKLGACLGSGPLPGSHSDLSGQSARDDAGCSPAQPTPRAGPIPSLTATPCRALLSRPSSPRAPPSGLCFMLTSDFSHVARCVLSPFLADIEKILFYSSNCAHYRYLLLFLKCFCRSGTLFNEPA